MKGFLWCCCTETQPDEIQLVVQSPPPPDKEKHEGSSLPRPPPGQASAPHALAANAYVDEQSIFDLMEGEVPPVRMLDGQWLLRRAEQIQKATTAAERRALALPRRQDLERLHPEAFTTVARLKAAPRGHDRVGSPLALVCASHAWHGPEHPDPEGDNLLVLVRSIQPCLTHGTPKKRLASDFAVFFDWCSLCQKERSSVEEAAFRYALARMQIIYCHQKTQVHMLTARPSGWTGLAYDERGWPTFERAVAAMLKMISKVFGPFPIVDAVVDHKGGEAAYPTIPVPRTPEAFVELLKTKTFTNGADLQVVADLYRTTIETAMGQAKFLRYVNLGWTDDDMRELVKVLPYCHEVERLALDENDDLTAAAAETLAACLRSGAMPKLKKLGFVRTGGGEDNPELVEACKERGIAMTWYAT